MAMVLCIEDEVTIRRDICEELESAGYKTVQAGNGVEGLAAIKQHRPDLVLCDITMPRMNGRDLLIEVRTNHPELADMPFILVSALADRDDVLTGLEDGADDYLTKPLDLDAMLAKIDATLRLVRRMHAKKEREQVKLFQAFAERVAGQSEGPTTPSTCEAPREDSIEAPMDAVPIASAASSDAKRDARQAVGRALGEQVMIKFQPVWSPKSEKVIAYHANAYQTIAGALGCDPREKHRAEVDIMVATKIVEHLELVVSTKEPSAIILTVNPETLLGPRRGTFTGLVRSIPEPERKQRLMIELASTTSKIEDAVLLEAIGKARDLAGNILLRAEPRDRIAALARANGVSSLSWRLPSNGEYKPTEIDDALSDFASAATRLGMPSYIYNVDMIGLVKGATRAGFSLVGGRAVAKELEQPGDPFILQAHRLFFD